VPVRAAALSTHVPVALLRPELAMCYGLLPSRLLSLLKTVGLQSTSLTLWVQTVGSDVCPSLSILCRTA
jgi:hypothetical protein